MKPQNIDDLQDALRLNDELVQALKELEKINQQLREELGLFPRKFFGRSSERHVEDDSQLHLFDLGEVRLGDSPSQTHVRQVQRGGRSSSGR